MELRNNLSQLGNFAQLLTLLASYPWCSRGLSLRESLGLCLLYHLPSKDQTHIHYISTVELTEVSSEESYIGQNFICETFFGNPCCKKLFEIPISDEHTIINDKNTSNNCSSETWPLMAHAWLLFKIQYLGMLLYGSLHTDLKSQSDLGSLNKT